MTSNVSVLHVALCLGKKKGGPQSKETLISMWNGEDFLLIDEVSIISCKFLLQISEALSSVKGNSLPFGGIKVIFAGDFAQLPPFQPWLDANLNSMELALKEKSETCWVASYG